MAEYQLLSLDKLSQRYEKENMPPTGSQLIKRNRDSGSTSTESQQGSPELSLEGIDISPQIKGTCGLSRLPIELLDMIFRKLDVELVFVVGLQNQKLWEVARRHILAYRLSCCGPWTGEGIICVGDCLEPTDSLPDVITKSEEEGLRKELNGNRFSTHDEGSTDSVPEPTGLYDIADAPYKQVESWESESSLARRLITGIAKIGEWHRVPALRKAQILDDLCRYDVSDFYPEDQPWILRNLTTQEYVRSEAIAIKPEYIHGPHIDGLGFGEAVLSRICWSTSESCSMTTNLNRGVWAGHRFDITTFDKHRQSCSGQAEWKDISEEVANEIEKIWYDQFGDDWRDEIRQ